MNPLSIYIHPYIFYQGKYGGIARYECELAAHHAEMGMDIHLPIDDTENEYLKAAAFYPAAAAETPPLPRFLKWTRRLMPTRQLRNKAKRYGLRRQALKALQRGRYDLIHPSYTNAVEILPHVGHTPLVITVHDMIHELFPGSFLSCDPTALRKRRFAERADRIIAISHRTKEDLVNICGVAPEKVDVVHHGNSLYLPENATEYPLSAPARYILFVGQRAHYKNFDILLKAFAALGDRGLHLVCAGGPPFSQEEYRQMAEAGVADRVSHRYVNDDELAVLYNRALCFVYPSRYEGFGLPLLEAFSCRAPVVCADASCFPEIAGKAACYFDPRKADDLTDILRELISSDSARQALVSAGTERLADFSWKRCAEETLRVYRSVL